MKVQFYIDIFFAVNATMDLLLLIFVRRVRKLKVRMIRIILSAITGALLSSCFVILPVNKEKVCTFLIGVLISVLMVMIAFGCHELRSFLCNYIFFISSSFFLGGAVRAVMDQVTVNCSYHPSFYGMMKGISLKILVLISVVLTPVIYYGYSLIAQLKVQESNCYHVRITLKDDCIICCEGFMDSGNVLYDPITGYPVIVANEQMFESRLKDKMQILSDRFCIIPYSSIGKRDGILTGFRADSVEIWQKTELDAVYTHHVVIALAKQGSGKKKDDMILLHRDLLRT